MSKATPYLLFDGNCAEAMAFYKECLGAELVLTKAGDSPMKAQFPPQLQEKIINAHLTVGDIDITASDWFRPTEKAKQGNMVCVYISGGTYEELKGYFERLSVGADPDFLDQLQDMPFGTYGALTDKYGVRWMFQGDKKA
jgi:PhnB protein